jgi:hypothetical protein
VETAMPGLNQPHSRVAHKSTGGTLQSIPEPVDPVGNPSTTPGGVDFYDSRSSLCSDVAQHILGPLRGRV